MRVLFAVIVASLTLAAPAHARGRRCDIVDPGELYSTYDVRGDDEAVATFRMAVGEARLDEAITHAHESTWPTAIATLEGRAAVRERITEYRGWCAGPWDDKYVVYVPAKKNRHMPDGMRPTTDIWFVFHGRGLTW